MDTQTIIYLVDDDEAVRDSLSILIKAVGLSIEVFASGEAFLEDAVRPLSGCVLLDLNMPGMSGLDVMRHLAKEESGHPVIIVTALADSKIKAEAISLGAAAVLEKPIRKEPLLASIRSALGAS